jgi:uncharacterized repeat protein (TIGR04076 family)
LQTGQQPGQGKCLTSPNRMHVRPKNKAKNNDMCISTWADIRPYIIVMAAGGKFDLMTNQNTALVIGLAPFRPVIFKIERIQ